MLQGKKGIGHPVDVATGTVYSTHKDISIPGKVDLTWERRYSTALLEMSPSPLGPGWTTRYFATLTQDKGEFQFITPEGEIEIFADPEGTVDRGGIVRNLGTFQELSRRSNQYIVTRWVVDTGEIERYVFKEGRKGETWPLASIEDVTGQGLDLLRDEAGRLTGVQQRLEKRTILIDYTAGNRISSVCFLMPDNQRQVLARYTYDKNGWLRDAYDALGYADSYKYDSKSRMTREMLKDGGDFYFKYDEQGRCIRTAGIDGYDEKMFRYLDGIRWTEVTNSLGHVMRFQWMPSNQIALEIDPLGAEKRTVYDEHGRIIEETNPSGGTRAYEYDEEGNRCKITNELGHVTTLTFNPNHQALSLIDPNGNRWQREYDRSNCLSQTVDPRGRRWTLAYDDDGNLVLVTNPAGGTLRQTFGPNGVLELFTDWENNATKLSFDSFGRVSERVGPLGDTTRFSHDALGNPTGVTLPNGARLSARYDAGGNLTSFTDANGRTTNYRFGTCRRLLQKTNPLGDSISYHWGTEPKLLLKIVNEKGETYWFDHDTAGRVVREVGFDGSERSFEYDAAGNCVATVDALDQRTAYEYDPGCNLVAEAFPDGTRSAFEYDPFHNIISAVNADCEVNFTRDLFGRIVSESQDDVVVEHEYDPVGNIVRTKTSLGYEGTYAFTPNGRMRRLTTAGGMSIEFERNPYREETARLLPGGIRLDQQYDDMGQMIEQRVTVSPEGPPAPEKLTGDGRSALPFNYTLIHRTYTYDGSRALMSIEDSFFGKTTYAYDPAERIVQALRERGTDERFSYDSSNNVTEIVRNGSGEAVEYGPGNRLHRRGNTRYFYDENGCLTRKVEDAEGEHPREWMFSWDVKGQLRSMTQPDGSVWEYTYDALGRRVGKSGPEETTRFVWDRHFVIHTLHGESLDATWLFDHASFKPLCKIQNDAIYSIITDHLGTPRELIDAAGNIVWAASLKTWGEIDQVRVDEVDCPIRFQGQWFDQESGLHYIRFRYYDPQVGRFISPDPIHLLGGRNTYAYAVTPTTRIDPFGLAEEHQIGTYSSLNGGSNVGDGLGAHELIRHQYLRDNGHTNGNNRNSDNPSIALSHAEHVETHRHERDIREERGLGRRGLASDLNTELDVTTEALRRTGVPDDTIDELRRNAEEYAEETGCD